MGRHRFPSSHLARLWLGAGLATASVLGFLAPSDAEAGVQRTRSDLSAKERTELVRGGLVARPFTLDQQGGHYVGGVSYVIVRAEPEDVLRHLMDVQSWAHFLPRVRSARLVDASGERARVELVQGNAVFSGKYTVGLERSGAGDEFRFWLDHTRPRDVRDVWGFVRVRPFGARSSLVAVGALVDVGPGVVRWLFEDAVQSLVLATPERIRAFVEPRALARAR